MRTGLALVLSVAAIAVGAAAPAAAKPSDPCPRSFTEVPAVVVGGAKGARSDRDDDAWVCVKLHAQGSASINVLDNR
jgi:hypothetical protein